MSSILLNRTIEMELQTCINCGCYFAIPKEMDSHLRNSRKSFYCPSGHPQNYVGETEAEKLQRELRRKEQELANKVQQQIQTQNELDKVNRKLKRVHNGTCPCCKRSFANLQQHMKTKHPEELKKSLK